MKKKGDLIVRDDAFHIEMITKLVTLLEKQNDSNFLKIIDEVDMNPNHNHDNQTNEYS